jgi:dTDP-4-amino-4,6-dideoxygalactose transaminase
MLTTNDDSVAKRVKVMRLHGINRDIWERHTSVGSSWEYDVIAPGFKYNMPDTAAAIGLAQLERANLFRQERERCAMFYFKNLADIDTLDLPKVRESMADHAWHLFSIVLNERSRVPRNRFLELMAEKGIGTSVHYKPLHRMTYYKERYGLRTEDFPNAERIWKGCVSLPIYPTLSDEELDYICKSIRDILD